METSAAFAPVGAGTSGPEVIPAFCQPAPDRAVEPDHALERALSLLRDTGATAVADAKLFGVAEASAFAGRVEELSRSVEYLQLVAAAAVDRTRRRANSVHQQSAAVGFGSDARGAATEGSPVGWLTGWSPEDVPAGTFARAVDPVTASVCLDDGYRNSTEFLRAWLRISAAEARRRLALAAEVLPRAGFADQPLPAAKKELAAAVAGGAVASHAASIITLALDRVRGVCPPDSAARMEHALTLTALENDHDFLARIARRWTEALDQDGAEPGAAELRQRQGAFVRRPRRGLQHLEIFATTEQFEHLLTVMNVATNPRAAALGGDAGSFAAGAEKPQACKPGPEPDSAAAGTAVVPDNPKVAEEAHFPDQRSRPQRLLDGLVGACKAALASGKLPAAGGLRPQVMVTIDYRDLLDRLGEPRRSPGGGGSGRRNPGTGSLTFTGPVTAATVRKIACDADIIPVLLGGSGRILDIGRASRIFPPHIRKALAARDRGCAFPQCTIPAPWCEAHHISYWSHGGTTGTDNAALLCSHHHHLIHKEQWTIELRSGAPWFLPPPHVDPRRIPRRNTYFRLD